ncbi:DUF6346 domain-containing protein [Saccharopolyspora tripterygii]
MTKTKKAQQDPAHVRLVLAAVCLVIGLFFGALGVIALVGSGATASDVDGRQQRSGSATPVECWSDGPLFLNFWEKCALQVRWQDGSTSNAVSVETDFSSENIGQRFPVVQNLPDGGHRPATMTVVRDVERPWAWIGWVAIFPLGLVGALFAIAAIVFAWPRFGGAGKRKR